MKSDVLKIANKKFKSRLIVGTGKYKNMKECAKAIKISGAEIVTVAVRRVNIEDKSKPLLMDYIDPKKIMYLPNTAGCFTSKDALRTLRLAREIGGWKIVKLEVLGDKKNLFPDMIETLKSTEVLTKEGFKVMVYCNDDPLMCKRLENSGASAIMPLAAPIGSGLGIQNKINIKILRNQTKVPLIIDAGIGQASDAVEAVFGSISGELSSGGEVRLVGFGTFMVANRKATTGRNPRTGETIQIAASKQPKFRPGKSLKESVNK